MEQGHDRYPHLSNGLLNVTLPVDEIEYIVILLIFSE